MKKVYFILVGLMTLFFTGCEVSESGEDLLARQQAEQTKLAAQTTGMPAIKNFTEKKNLKMILEMRDNPQLKTFTYIKNIDGKMVKLCDSVGYPMPYSTQYTNPEFIADTSSAGYVTLPMADPNGLYSPDNAEGSYIMCFSEHALYPVYSEERLTTSPFPLH